MTALAETPDGAEAPANPPEEANWWRLSRLWPIAFVLTLASFYHIVFVSKHCLPLMAPGAGGLRNPNYDKGLAQLIVFHVAQALFLYCYFRCMFTPPGGIPDSAEWKFSDDESAVPFVERKRCGERRYCRWCTRFKPDRTHHCRTCRSCVLKMDHHCPWTNNCIGFRNHKAFLLCILYTLIGVDLVAVSHLTSDPFEDLFPDNPGISMTVSVFWTLFAALFTFFCCFHVYLVCFAYTTLEFRERIWNTKSGKSPYDAGVYRNICSVLGENPLLWFVPVLNAPGHGVHWFHEDGECDGYDSQREDDPLLLNDGATGSKGAAGVKKEAFADSPQKSTSRTGDSDPGGPPYASAGGTGSGPTGDGSTEVAEASPHDSGCKGDTGGQEGGEHQESSAKPGSE